MKKEDLEKKTAQVCDLVMNRMTDGKRTIVGVAGAPASGKSTLAAKVVDHLNANGNGDAPLAALLPMDGYHLDNRILEKRGLLARKGAPETFDAVGFCEAVKGLASGSPCTFFPSFDRTLDIAIAGAIEITPATHVIVVEGNYLLLKSSPWNSLADHFTTTIFINPGLGILTARLNKRWLRHGLDPEAAAKRTETNDLVNARLVLSQSAKADLELS
ncbi:nucleoside/nucleotide kinase family protein [uncultured Cohaesibacter sp.]|uniref:nucleoside/nucleotide kinase family protein n=1 Tax=uncultured Cohaesibacter sp. TaxID=1002546 RepID=UPI002930F57F|nr:nucleoside/nucleotide kinase family protein [uncultured Cohaesibacter sp.]